MHPSVRRAIPSPIYRKLRQRRIHQRIAAFEPRQVEHVYGGARLRINLRDALAEGWYDHDWGSQPEIEALKRGRLVPGATVFDLGAHQAIVALMLAREVGPEGAVIAVEAEPHNVAVARTNIDLNSATNIVVVAAAVSDKVGHAFFSEGLNGAVLPGGRTGKIRVDAVTVDELARHHGSPDVVFVDVEGYEELALRGATETLDAKETDFFVEIHDAATLGACGGDARGVAGHFVSRGYECLTAPASDGPLEGDFRPIDPMLLDRGERCYLIAYAGRRSQAGS